MKKQSQLIIFMSLCAGLAVLLWSRTVTSGAPWPVYLHDLSRLLALVIFILIFFQYLLSSRIKWIEKGIGLDRLILRHKTFGLVLFIVPLGHPVLILLSERLQGYSTPLSLLKILGLLALLFIWAGAGAALLYGKTSLKYETWKRIHKVGYAVFPLAFFHSTFMGSTLQRSPMKVFWFILALIYVLILAGNIRRRFALRRHPFTVTEVSRETNDIWTLRFAGDRRDFAPGQFMILQLVRRGKVSETHPFTISSPPTRKGLAVCVKETGDFTSDIGKTKPSDTAYIDMPYGVFFFPHFDTDRLVFIAGGIGITPFLSMLRTLYDRSIEKEVILLWGNKREKDIVFREELERMASEMPSLKIIHVLSRQEDWPGERGHIDADILKKHIGEFPGREFFICGPPSMMKSVENVLSDLGASKKRVHTERFALR